MKHFSLHRYNYDVWTWPFIDRWLDEKEFEFSALRCTEFTKNIVEERIIRSKIQSILDIENFARLDEIGCSSSAIDLFSFLFRVIEFFTARFSYSANHVLRLCTIVSKSVESYCGKLLEIVCSDLNIEESKEIWGMVREKSGSLSINIQPRIYLIFNNIQLCYIRIKSMAGIYKFSKMYAAARTKYSTYEAHEDGISLDVMDKVRDSYDGQTSESKLVTDILSFAHLEKKLRLSLQSIESRISKGVCYLNFEFLLLNSLDM
jgi:hypothetical protein